MVKMITLLYIFYNKKPLKKSTPLLPPDTTVFLCSNNKASQKVVYICSHHFFTYFLLNSFQFIFRLHHYTIMVFSPKSFNLIHPRFFSIVILLASYIRSTGQQEALSLKLSLPLVPISLFILSPTLLVLYATSFPAPS